MLHHVLVNLIDNAAKCASAGTVIPAEGKRTPTGVTLAILDQGRGIPPGRSHDLFERFHRFEGDDRQGGTGLGLAIVKGFADATGLSVAAANDAFGTGLRFSVLWPEPLVRRVQTTQDGK